MFKTNWFLVSIYIKKRKLLLTDVPVSYRRRGGFKLHDYHWLAVILSGGHNNETIDYLDYIDAKDGCSSLYDLPRNDKIKFVT